MDTVQTIGKVMRAEAKLFARSWVFRFLILFAVLGIGFFSYIFFVRGQLSWMMRGMPASFPYFLFLLLTIFQSLIVIFGAIDSIHRDQKLDTFESMHVRSMSNLTYLAGKAAGIMLPCLIMSLVFGALAFIVEIFFIHDVPFSPLSYVTYLLLINIPALLFITGLSFMVISVVKSKILAMHLLLIFFVVPFLYRSGIFTGLFDFAALHLPLMPSTIVGMENLGSVLLHRGLFVFLGLGGILLSSLMFPRLYQSNAVRRFSRIALAGCAAAAVLMVVVHTTGIMSGIRFREHIQALNEEIAGKPRARLAACDLDITHSGSSLDVTADLTLLNHHDTPLQTLYFSLNPGFTVRSVDTAGGDLDFTRDTQIITIDLPEPLAPGAEMALTIAYDGAVNDDACYPDISWRERLSPNRAFIYSISKRYGFVTNDYVLLTPECEWYPVPGVPHGLVFPDAHERDFTAFTMDVDTRDGLSVVSQGAITSNGGGSFSVRPETRLTALSLAVGDYEKRSTEVDGVEVAEYNLKGNFFFIVPPGLTAEGISDGLMALKQNYEGNRNMTYPFSRYAAVEVPVQFCAYERPWKTYMETAQPQISLVPERGFFITALRNNLFDISAMMETYERAGLLDQISPDQIMASQIQSMYDVFFSDWNQRESSRERRAGGRKLSILQTLNQMFQTNYIPGYTMSVQYYPYLISFESEKYPVFNTMMEFYRKHGLNTNTNMMLNRSSKPVYDEEIACMALQEDSFENYLNNGTDFNTMNLLLTLKANHLFGALQARIGSTGFDAFLNEYVTEHTFESVSYEQFRDDVQEEFGLNLDDIFETWFSESRLPMFVVDNVSLTEIIDDEYTCYQTRFTVSNIEPVPGTMWMQARLRDYGNTIERETRFIMLEGNQTKEIGFVTDTPPPNLEFNGIISQNIPLIHSITLGQPKEDHDAEPFEGERITAYSPPAPEPGTIVVDNLDSGFEVISNPEDIDDGRNATRYGFGEYPGDFIAPIMSSPPKRWGKTVIPSAFGINKTALYAAGGDGDGKVAWHADISDGGRYELEYYIGEVSSTWVVVREDGTLVTESSDFFEDYNLTVTNGGQSNDISFLPKQDDPGWQYVGTFDLEPGTADVVLCNKSDGACIYADAIRWVKK